MSNIPEPLPFMDAKPAECILQIPPPIFAYDNWLMYQAQSMMTRNGKAAELPQPEQAREFFQHVDVNTRERVE